MPAATKTHSAHANWRLGGWKLSSQLPTHSHTHAHMKADPPTPPPLLSTPRPPPQKQSMRESGRAEQITATIIETARQCNLDKDVALPADDEAVKGMSMDERDLVIGNVYR